MKWDGASRFALIIERKIAPNHCFLYLLQMMTCDSAGNISKLKISHQWWNDLFFLLEKLQAISRMQKSEWVVDIKEWKEKK